MLFKDYIEVIKSAEETENVTFGYNAYTYISGVMRRASMCVTALGDTDSEVIKLPNQNMQSIRPFHVQGDLNLF